MLGMDIDAWNNIRIATWGLAAVGAVLALISNYVQLQLQKAESKTATETLERYKLDATRDVAAANASAAAAKTEAALANERTAKHELDLQFERRLRANLERTVQPRYINKDEAAILAEGFKGMTELTIFSIDDVEAAFFASNIGQVLSETGITVHSQRAPQDFKPHGMMVCADEHFPGEAQSALLFATAGPMNGGVVATVKEGTYPWLKPNSIVVGLRSLGSIQINPAVP